MSDAIPPPRAKRGCFFYGCISLIVLLLVGVIGSVVVYRIVSNTLARMVTDYTDTKAAPLPTANYTPEQLAELQGRVKVFQDALDAGREGQELVLTADDLNALAAEEPELKGRVHVRIDGSEIKGEVSIPLKDLPFEKVRDRYLNGTAAFTVALTNGTLDVRLRELEAKGKPLPAMLRKELTKRNLAQDVMNNPQQAANIRRFESITVADGKVIVRSRGKTAEASTPAPPP